MSRMNFGVVTLTVAFFVILAGIIAALRPFIPAQEANELVNELGEYMAMGVNQSIDWLPLDDDALADSRRTGRPILLALGTVWSSDASKADRIFFADPEVQSYLHRNFVCVRVDLDRHPAYSSVLAPLGRVDNAFTVGFQIVFVRPDGMPYRFLSISGIPDDAAEFLNQLVAAHGEFIEKTTQETTQENDRSILIERNLSPVSASSYVDNLIRFIDPDRGGFVNSPPTARMEAWRALLLSGQGEAFDLAAAPYIRSGLVDWLDGGFFSRAADSGLRQVLFAKPSLFNAEIMYTLALGGHVRQNGHYTRIAKNTFDWLTGKAMDGDYVATARIGQANQFGRAPRTSIDVKDMREFLGSGLLERDEVVWARKNLGLTVEDNPSMVVRIADPAVLNDPVFAKVISKLRKQKETSDLKFTKEPRADVNGIVLARLTDCARLWGDPDRLAICRRLFARLEKFRGGTDIAHILPYDLKQERFLGDYLGFADAALSLYCATGNADYFRSGEAVLRRAHQLFAASSPGVWTPMTSPNSQPLKSIDVPEVIDNMGESLTARMMRLAASYFRLSPTQELGAVNEFAFEALNRYSGLLPQTGLLGGGLYCSTAFMIDDEAAVVVGQNAATAADDIFRATPFRLVSPALPEFGSKSPGIYLLENGASSLVTREQAIDRLPASLSPG